MATRPYAATEKAADSGLLILDGDGWRVVMAALQLANYPEPPEFGKETEATSA